MYSICNHCFQTIPRDPYPSFPMSGVEKDGPNPIPTIGLVRVNPFLRTHLDPQGECETFLFASGETVGFLAKFQKNQGLTPTTQGKDRRIGRKMTFLKSLWSMKDC